ncbi:hypothetical protein V2J09_013866 [Rumex salicifolius]
MNGKKRKGSGINDSRDRSSDEILQLRSEPGSVLRAHFSLENCNRLKKKFREDVRDENHPESNIRVVGVTTVPPCIGLSSVETSRGLKRKIGCIDVATQIGRKKKLEDDYIMIETIGKGKFGSVWLCKHKVTAAEFACKTLSKGEETVHKEVEIMQHLSGHPGVVMLNAVYEDANCFHLVMELCSEGRLVDQMAKEGRYSEQQAACLMKELMIVIKYCHDMGVVHRDIKPENILLTSSGKMKLADFGLAMRVANGQSLSGLAGSPAYVAPEVLSGSYREKADVWSAGVLLYALLAGALPFQGKSLEEIFDAIKNVELDFHSDMWKCISKPARNLVERMLSRDVSKRITVEEVLGHPWILFYTTRMLKSLPTKPKASNGYETSSRQLVSTSLPKTTDRSKTNSGSVYGSSSLVSSAKRRVDSTSLELEESSAIDVLTAAISQVRISDTKRSRLCYSSPPISPIQQQFSASSLCEAF